MEIFVKTFIALCMLLSFGVLAGCNTMEGVGKDIGRGGEKIEGAAQRNR